MEIAVLVVAVIAHLALGYFTFYHNPKSYTHRFFFAFTIIAAIWGVNQYRSLHQDTPSETLDVIRWAMVLAALYSYSLFLTIQTFPSSKLRLNAFWITLFSVLTLIVCVLSRTSLIFSDIKGNGPTAEPLPGPMIGLFALTAGFFIFGSIILLIIRYRRAKGIYKAQLQYLIIGVVGSAFILFLTNFLLVALFEITSFIIFGPAATLIFIGATTYAIIAKRLFDIKLIIKRTVVYSVLLGAILIIYSVVIFFFSQVFGGEITLGFSTFVPNAIAAILIAIGYDPLKQWLQRTTDRYLFKGEYDPQDLASELAKMLSNVVNLDEALDSMMSVVTKDMRVARVAMLVIRKIDKDMVVKRVKATGFSNVVKLEDFPTGSLIQYFVKNPHLLVLEELQGDDASAADSSVSHVLKQLEQFHAAVALPLVVKGQIIGILMVGERLSGDTFSRQDLDTLDLIGSQTALSIEKAQFYEDDKLKSEFISIASHELLTPTSAIEGYLSMALDEKMPQTKEQHHQYMQRAYDSSRRLADLVKDLLSISRIESGRMKIVPTPLDIVAIIDQAAGELQVTAKEKGLSLEFTKPTEKIPKVIADQDRIMQVCINLINNSIKYTPKGGIKVAVKQEGQFVRVAVTDTGIGISKEDQQHLFEKFHRIDNPATAGIMGTGLGLYIVKNIITLLGGTVKVDSVAEKGSTFSFTLPVAK